MKTILQFIIIILIVVNNNAIACSIVRIAKDGEVLVGNNEDWRDNRTKIWFMPNTKNENGRVCFGFKDAYSFTQGGMNDKGLFLDAIATKSTGWKANPVKPDFNGQTNDYILANFSTVEEVKKFFETYNVFLNNGLFVVADSTGRSMIIEWADGAYNYIESDKYYQIVTDFIQPGIKEEEISDRRYNIAKKIVTNENEASMNTVKKVLSAIHREWFIPTIYSYICDLKSKTVYVYNFHNFNETFQIDLKEELKKGKHYYDLPSQFSVKTEAAYLFEEIAPKRGVDEIVKIIETEGIIKANFWFQKVREEKLSTPIYIFGENDLVSLGYKYLKEKKYDLAIAVFIIATEAHPNSYNTWDSLAEGYMNKSENKKAIEFYKKSLELNPKNDNAVKQLEILENDS
jgi:tetratricopeptide (TPR) repeat protein